MKSDLFGFDDITSPTSIPLGAPVHRSHSGSSIPALPMQQSNGANSPMRGGPMGGSGRGGPMNPMGGPMSGRGTNIMGFDAFNNMTPNQNPPYRGQPGRR